MIPLLCNSGPLAALSIIGFTIIVCMGIAYGHRWFHL